MIRWTFPHIHVSRRPHDASHNFTGHPPGGASPDARRAAPCPVWLPPGTARVTVVCGRAHPDRYRGLLMLFALQYLPHRACLSRRPPGLHNPPDKEGLPAARGLAQGASSRLRLVPYALELRHAGGPVVCQARPRGVGRDRAALAPRTWLGLEAGQARRQRYRSPPGRAVGPYPVPFRAPAGTRGDGVCGRARYPSDTQSRLCLDTQRRPEDRHDPRPERQALFGRRARSHHREAGTLSWVPQKQWIVPGPPHAAGPDVPGPMGQAHLCGGQL